MRYWCEVAGRGSFMLHDSFLGLLAPNISESFSAASITILPSVALRFWVKRVMGTGAEQRKTCSLYTENSNRVQ